MANFGTVNKDPIWPLLAPKFLESGDFTISGSGNAGDFRHSLHGFNSCQQKEQRVCYTMKGFSANNAHWAINYCSYYRKFILKPSL